MADDKFSEKLRGWIAEKLLGKDVVRAYAAAKNYPWSHFPTGGNKAQSQNYETATSYHKIAARTQQLVRDFPPFAAAVNNASDFIIGEGIRLQSLVRKSDGSADYETSKKIEEWWEDWCTKCDQSGNLTFTEMQALAVRNEMTTGDWMMVENFDRRRNRPHTFRMVDPTTLSDRNLLNLAEAGNGIWFGIEYDPSTLEKKAYHFQSHNDFGSTSDFSVQRIGAERVLHDYLHTGADQLRGVSPFASAILLANSQRDYMQAELATQKAHSKWIGFVTAPGFGNGTQWNKAQWEEAQQKWLEKIEYASMELLQPGQTVTMNSTQRSPYGVEAYTGLVLRMVAASVSQPYEMLSKDYRGMNYTVSRMVRNDFRQALRPQWKRKIDHLCRPVFERAMDKAVLMGDLVLPGYYSGRRREYQRCMWIPPGMETVDPVKEATANQILVKMGLKDPQSIMMAAGQDPERVVANLKTWKQMMKDNDLEELWNLQAEIVVPPDIEEDEMKDSANSDQKKGDQ